MENDNVEDNNFASDHVIYKEPEYLESSPADAIKIADYVIYQDPEYLESFFPADAIKIADLVMYKSPSSPDSWMVYIKKENGKYRSAAGIGELALRVAFGVKELQDEIKSIKETLSQLI